MQQATAKLSNLSITPRKVRLLVDVIRGKHVNAALAQIQMANIRPADAIKKLLLSAISNAKNQKMDVNKLYVKTIMVNTGPMLKRFLPRARGSATELQKKYSHVIVVLAESDTVKAPNYLILAKPKKNKKPVKETTKKEKPKKEAEEKIGGEKKGFVKQIFNRKSV